MLILSYPLGQFPQSSPVPTVVERTLAEITANVRPDQNHARAPTTRKGWCSLCAHRSFRGLQQTSLDKPLSKYLICAKTLKHWVLVGLVAWYRGPPTFNTYKNPDPADWTRRQTCLLHRSWPNRRPSCATLHVLDQIAYNMQHKHIHELFPKIQEVTSTPEYRSEFTKSTVHKIYVGLQ